MKNTIFNIYDFNEKSGLISDYDIKKETALLLEELLEQYIIENPRKEARSFVKDSYLCKIPVDSDVEIIDAYIDIIYIAIGSLIKKYYSILPNELKNKENVAQFIIKGINNVIEANKSKVGNKLDAEGKLTKTSDFQPPKIPLKMEDL